MRPLTLLQRQRITLSLFFTVAVGAVFTVATPAFVPWQVVDTKRAQALDQQRRQGKDFHVVEDRRHRHNQQQRSSSSNETTSNSSSNDDDHTKVGSESDQDKHTPSSQGPLISLLTDRPNPERNTSNTLSITREPLISATTSDSSSLETEALYTDGSTAPKKRRRRRKRKMVNEGWQELTGRTAREEKEKQEYQQHQQNHTQSDSKSPPVLGENGGIEINWKNKTNT